MKRLLAPLACLLVPVAAVVAAPPHQTPKQVQAIIWAKEQAIYAARGRGDMGPYKASLARDYAAWPPTTAQPMGPANLTLKQSGSTVINQELLTMQFVKIVINGDAAVIYYTTHRTRLPTGAPVDERFEVTHSWVFQDGAWRVMGGMARATPVR